MTEGNYGHNSGDKPPKVTPDDLRESSASAQELRQLIERAEKIEEEKQALSEDLKDLLSEAKGRGFSVPAMRKILAIRKADPAKRQELEAMCQLYGSALQMPEFMLL